MNEEIEKLLSAMTNIEDRLGQLSTTEETEKVKAELAELGKKQLGLAEEIRPYISAKFPAGPPIWPGRKPAAALLPHRRKTYSPPAHNSCPL